MQRLTLLLTLLFVTAVCGAQAGEFRAFKPISTPGAAPGGAKPVAEVAPIDPGQAREVAEKVFKAWNSGGLEKYLADDFYDKSRLLDAIDEKVPRDAQIRIMSIQGVQTLQQYQRPMGTGEGKEIISTVSVTADTQIEFNDVIKGFRRLEGVNEYILRITEEVVE